MPAWEMLLRIGTSAGLGMLIGLEREYRSRMAGVRTHALVAVGATLFVLLSAYGFAGAPGACRADPTRIAAQIVSGIGFLGAGVILRDGWKVRGLNTAATLWCSAAVGTLAGAGLYLVAAVGTAAVLGANIVLRSAARIVELHFRSETPADDEHEPPDGAETNRDHSGGRPPHGSARRRSGHGH